MCSLVTVSKRVAVEPNCSQIELIEEQNRQAPSKVCSKYPLRRAEDHCAMPQVYEILVRGHLSEDWSEWFGGLTIENLPNGEALLRCTAADQAALHGLLGRIRDLNLPLISVVRGQPAGDHEHE